MKRINIRTVLFSAFVLGLIVVFNYTAKASGLDFNDPNNEALVYHPIAQDTLIPRYNNFSGNYQNNPFDLQDPFPFYQRARKEEPIFFNEELGYWVVTKWADLKAIFKDWKT